MTRAVTFPDGITAATPPDVTPGSQESFPILDNQSVYTPLLNTDGDQLVLDESDCVSAFIEYELARSNLTDSFIQMGRINAIKDPTTGWMIVPGNYIGSDLIQEDDDTIDNDQEIILSIDSTTGEVTYKSGALTGGVDYVGNLILIITRIFI